MLRSWIDTSWVHTLQLDLFLHDWDTRNSCSKVHWPWLESHGFWGEQLRTHGVNLKQRKMYSEETSPIISYHFNHMNPFIFLGFWWSGVGVFFPSFFCLIDPTFCFMLGRGPHSLPSMKPFSSVSICLKIAFFLARKIHAGISGDPNGCGDSYTKMSKKGVSLVRLRKETLQFPGETPYVWTSHPY